MSIYKEPPPGMFVVPDPHDMTKVRDTLEWVQIPTLLYVVVGGCSEILPNGVIPSCFERSQGESCKSTAQLWFSW